MRSAVTVCLISQARKGPFVFHDGLEEGFAQAEKLGFDAVEIFVPSPSSADVAQIRSLCERYRMGISAFGTGAGAIIHQWTLTSGDDNVRAQAVAFINQFIDLAGQLNAPAIIGSMTGRIADETERESIMSLLAESIRSFGQRAERYGVPVLIEPLNRYESNIFNRVDLSAQWVRDNACSNVKILADLFHMNIEEADISKSLRDAGELVGHVHFADSNRQAIGLGHTEIQPVIDTLKQMKYSGYLSAEVFPLPDAFTAARTTIESFRKLV